MPNEQTTPTRTLLDEIAEYLETHPPVPGMAIPVTDPALSCTCCPECPECICHLPDDERTEVINAEA